MPKAIVTGSAGFIGYHLCARLLREGWEVTGFDALTPYYDVSLKERRHAMLSQSSGFRAIVARLEDDRCFAALMAEDKPDVVVHLAAQAGVRYSIEEPRSYVDANLIGTFNVLEAVRAYPVSHLLMASTSSVYGANTKMPYAETDKADSQMSFYAATKKATEAMAHSYAHLYGLPTTMFRFFTVYGPWGRPDMALFKFTKAMLNGDPIDIYNHGEMRRDFTYVDDLVESLFRLIPIAPPQVSRRKAAVPNDSLSEVAPFRILNIGNAQPVQLMDFVVEIERALGTTATKNFLPMQPGDVPATWADTRLLQELTGNLPATPVDKGVAQFVEWYREYYAV